MIRQVRIQNFRSIKDAKFSPTPLCALIGRNNSGKSNILKALDLVLGDRWPTSRSLADQDVFAYDPDRDIVISIWFDETWEVRGDVGDPVLASGVEFRLTRYKRASGKHRKGDLRSELYCIDGEGQVVEVLKRHPKNPKKPYSTAASVTSEIREQFPTVFVDVDRNAKRHLSGSQWSILGRLLLDVATDLRADPVRSAEFRTHFEKAQETLRTPSFVTLQKKVVENLEAHTGLKGVSVRLDEVDPLNLYKTFTVLFQDPETPEPVDAERMGSGVQSAVVVSLLQAYRELRKDNAILLFEEPELFLHPHGRRHLFRLLAELADGGTQVIYTTHSQDFVDLERVDCVQLVSKSLADGTTARPPRAGPLKRKARKKLKVLRHFSAPRNEIFFAESVVLVEGITEQGAIGLLCDLVPGGLDLDAESCSVVEVNGKPNMPLFIRMVQALGKRCLVIYDTDSHHMDPDDIETDRRRNQQISDALDASVEACPCDPYFEEVAGIAGTSKKDKEERARAHFEAVAGWADLSSEIQAMMLRIKAHATAADSSDSKPA